jgi:hypothetical protein
MRNAARPPDANVSAAMVHVAASSPKASATAGEERAHGVAQVAPQAVHAHGGSAPRRMGYIADRCE